MPLWCLTRTLTRGAPGTRLVALPLPPARRQRAALYRGHGAPQRTHPVHAPRCAAASACVPRYCPPAPGTAAALEARHPAWAAPIVQTWKTRLECGTGSHQFSFPSLHPPPRLHPHPRSAPNASSSSSNYNKLCDLLLCPMVARVAVFRRPASAVHRFIRPPLCRDIVLVSSSPEYLRLGSFALTRKASGTARCHRDHGDPRVRHSVPSPKAQAVHTYSSYNVR